MVERVRELLYKYDKEADVFYINFFNPPLEADDSRTIGPCIIRLKEGKVIGVTILDWRQSSEGPPK